MERLGYPSQVGHFTCIEGGAIAYAARRARKATLGILDFWREYACIGPPYCAV